MNPLSLRALKSIADLLPARKGVMGVLRRIREDGQIYEEPYVVPMPPKEQAKGGATKYDHVFNEDEILDHGSSANAKYDFVGGGVHRDEDVMAALLREIVAELKQLYYEDDEPVPTAQFMDMFGSIAIQWPGHIAPFMQLQTLQNGVERPRGIFRELYWFNILLTSRQLNGLKEIGARPLSSVDPSHLRPHVRVFQKLIEKKKREEAGV